MSEEIKSLIFKLIISASKSKPIDSKTLSSFVKSKFNLNAYPGPKVRKVINELRREEIPVLANHNGYWISYEPEQIAEQIVSMKGRIDIQIAALDGLTKCLKTIKN